MPASQGRPCGAYGPAGTCGATPARLYPRGWCCDQHAPDASVHVTPMPPPHRMFRADPPGLCRYCGEISYNADETGTVHACCHAWRRVIAAGHPCPVCQVAVRHRGAVNSRTRNKPPSLPILPPLPRTLPDGTPFTPDFGD